MRVTYQREMKVKAALDKLEVENFLPMKTALTEQGGHRHYKTVPAVNNLIFLHSTQEVITRIKNEYEDLKALRYIMTRPLDGSRPQPITIPPLEMENFIRVASLTDERVMHLDLSDVEGKTINQFPNSLTICCYKYGRDRYSQQKRFYESGFLVFIPPEKSLKFRVNDYLSVFIHVKYFTE